MDAGNAENVKSIEALKDVIDEQNHKLSFLTKVLEQKDDVIHLLIKEKDILENEKKKVTTELNAAIKEKENIVIRFAIAEKNILDLKETLESTEKRRRKGERDCDFLNNELKLAQDEKSRIDAALALKSQEYRNSSRCIEKLKNEISSLETKFKWNTVKLKKEMNSTQTNQAAIGNENAIKNERTIALEEALEKTTRELQEITLLLENNSKKEQNLQDENDYFQQNILELQNVLDVNALKLAELDAIKSQLISQQKTNSEHKKRLKEMANIIKDQAASIVEYNDKELKLLKLNAELSTLNAKFINKMSLHKSKVLALMLDNKHINDAQVEYQCNILKLKKNLEVEKKARFDERLLMARHLAEKSKENSVLQNKLEQAYVEAPAKKKKNYY
ncbi:myosin-11 [Sabethes cyaneus]|uniref:myosin-11 n=1 Tax=Sabethes cyaneus TaxID=53552 RepID=UPI00237EA3DC|nr:myosin-11 [Sabethes cyaneus]